MRVKGRPYRTLWPGSDGASVEIIDQTRLPHEFATARLTNLDQTAHAIRRMQVRGAQLIAALAAYGLWLALRTDPSDGGLLRAGTVLLATRPTAINLQRAIDRMTAWLMPLPPSWRVAAALERAAQLCEEDIAINRAIGDHGLAIIRELLGREPGGAVLNVLTHGDAGWLAAVDEGTAAAPIYAAHDAGIPVHVWINESGPSDPGASLTAWELLIHGVPHTLISDTTGGHLMQRGEIDLVVVGSDRTTAAGDVCNTTGTYFKALAARDNHVPFYVAVPSPSIDWTVRDGLREILTESRPSLEAIHLAGRTPDGNGAAAALTSEGSAAAHPAFDMTPARLITGLITERGVAEASEAGLKRLFPNN